MNIRETIISRSLKMHINIQRSNLTRRVNSKCIISKLNIKIKSTHQLKSLLNNKHYPRSKFKNYNLK